MILLEVFLFCYCVLGYYYSSLRDNVKHQQLIRNRNDPYQYVHDVFRSKNYTTIDKWVSKEPLFNPISYELKDNIIWNGKSMCYDDTFVLLLYFVDKKDVERRQVIREYVKQNMSVDGKRISYAFVVASPLNDTKVLDELRVENLKYGDILISMHEDNYRLFTVTILDAFYWVREYCKTAAFVARLDGDIWVHLGNLLHCLQRIPQKRMLLAVRQRYEHRGSLHYKGVPSIPFDYPQPFFYAYGAAYVVSRDVVPYINIGALYLSCVLPVHEDVVISEILKKAGIGIFLRSNYTIVKNYKVNLSIPQNVLFVHRVKNISLFKTMYSNFSSFYKTPI